MPKSIFEQWVEGDVEANNVKLEFENTGITMG